MPGLYTIVESVDRTFLGKHFENDEGFLYKYDYNPGDTPYYFEYKGPMRRVYVPLPFKPETHESDPQPAAIVDMIRTVAEASDAVFRSQIAQFLDLTQVHQAPGDRDISRRQRRVRRQLRDEQLLSPPTCRTRRCSR